MSCLLFGCPKYIRKPEAIVKYLQEQCSVRAKNFTILWILRGICAVYLWSVEKFQLIKNLFQQCVGHLVHLGQVLAVVTIESVIAVNYIQQHLYLKFLLCLIQIQQEVTVCFILYLSISPLAYRESNLSIKMYPTHLRYMSILYLNITSGTCTIS